MSYSPRTELLIIQKKLYRKNKKLIENSIKIKEPDFIRYEKDYRLCVGDYFRVASEEEMIGATLKADIVYVGDYHTCNQSQRSFLRILKASVARDNNFIIGLELIHKRHQNIIDRYLKGQLTDERFLKNIGLKEHWVFDLWENFKPLFDFARYHSVPIVGIDAAPANASIRQRDKASASLIAQIVAKNPGKKIFIFIGDLHIAKKHLPSDISRILKQKGDSPRSLILYENSELIYWKLADRGLEDKVEVVLLKDGNFCRMHTPPIICQQSYLNWLEHEEGEIDYADAKISFLDLVMRITQFLRIKLGSQVDSVEVFTCGDLSFLKKLAESGSFSKKELAVIKQQILSSESYYIARARYVYLANLSVNHAAEEAAHFIKHLASGEEKPREILDAFYANTLHEALGFFGSKLINHKRKCFHEKGFKDLVKFFKTIRVPPYRKLEEETAKFVLEHKKLEAKNSPLRTWNIFEGRIDFFHSVSHALGYMLGDRLYYGMMEGVLSRKRIRELFFNPWRKGGAASSEYFNLVRALRRVKIPKRI